ncbi:MAG TPA: aldehyde dehydrogenase (NADP(+)) [Terracidiphilus sp.]|jgi:NADP-dependent aldehyde dehydrogenase|nr:aldehyde dehydrogenase (NADP(+)) [Terracidiphilus sp.]
MELHGKSLLGTKQATSDGGCFRAINPATGAKLEPVFCSASTTEVDEAVQLAAEAFETYSQTSGKARAAFLRRIADGLDAHKDELAARAHLETALPLPRLTGEVGRTSGQLRLFAGVVEEGSWVNARIDTALPERQPLPRPDLRSMLRPLGPVVVFGASNFPLAFSVAGGDTASALAAGCPVIGKAHPAHPGTSEIVGRILSEAVAAEGLHPGVFSLVFDAGVEAGTALVKHPLVRAVAFTGSLRAGRALMDLAAARPDPIPCFTEMSSGNPVFVLPGALRKGPGALAASLFGSFTLGAGQFCTKPGVILVPGSAESTTFVEELGKLVDEAQPYTLLTPGIARAYGRATTERAATTAAAATGARPNPEHACTVNAQLFTVSLSQFLATPALADEIFGPNTLLVRCDSTNDYLKAARSLDGHLTATILGDDEDLAANRELIQILEQKAGRLIFNGFPTGVEVSHAMVHGGPYPSTSDARFTSVGSLAIYRFARPVCFQAFPPALLPPELQDGNPLGIRRLVDGKAEKL